MHHTSKLYFSHYHMQHICETSPPSDTTSHPSVSLNKFTHHTSFKSLFSISTSLMKNYGNCGPVNKLNQDPNNYYESPKIPYVAKLRYRYFSMVSIASMGFLTGTFINKFYPYLQVQWSSAVSSSPSEDQVYLEYIATLKRHFSYIQDF